MLTERGMLLESARGPIPNVAELVAGAPIKGSWWGHPAGHTIFDAINELADSPDVVPRASRERQDHARPSSGVARARTRRLAFPAERLASITEEHTASGAHRKVETPFPDWVSPDVIDAARRLSEADAYALLPDCLRPT